MSSAVAAKYIINKDGVTDEIVCHGKETMTLEQLEKTLKKHFKDIADKEATIVEEPIKTVPIVKDTVVKQLDTTTSDATKSNFSESGEEKKSAGEHISDALTATQKAAQAAVSSVREYTRKQLETAQGTALGLT